MELWLEQLRSEQLKSLSGCSTFDSYLRKDGGLQMLDRLLGGMREGLKDTWKDATGQNPEGP